MADQTTLSSIMNTYSAVSGTPVPPVMLGGRSGRGRKRKEITEFLNHVPKRLLNELRKNIKRGNDMTVINLACGYVIKYFQHIPIKSCIYHGEFVYELIKKAMSKK